LFHTTRNKGLPTIKIPLSIGRPAAGRLKFRGAQAEFQDPCQPVGEQARVGGALAIEYPRLIEQEMGGVVLEGAPVVAQTCKCDNKLVTRVHFQDRLCSRRDPPRAGEQFLELTVGTVLGGIWADQSWGRFWGWDPKENGALIIVIWNALILHARWGGLVRQRGLICLAIFGNIVTSWSWFGTNMLGIGLHSYGFTEAAFWWLSAFIALQLALIALGNLPLEKWRSFRPAA